MAGKRNTSSTGAVGIGWVLGAKSWSMIPTGSAHHHGLRGAIRRHQGKDGHRSHGTTTMDSNEETGQAVLDTGLHARGQEETQRTAERTGTQIDFGPGGENHAMQHEGTFGNATTL